MFIRGSGFLPRAQSVFASDASRMAKGWLSLRRWVALLEGGSPSVTPAHENVKRFTLEPKSCGAIINQPIFEQETDMGLLDILNGLQNRPDVAPALGSGGGGMSPLMKALLGMIAFKAIRSLTGSSQSSGAAGGAAASAGGGLGDLLGGLGGLLGGGAAGGTLVGGLSDLLKQFEQSGKGEVAQSWVGSGPNKAISPADLANTLGADKVNALMAYSGMSRDDMLHGLSQQLPELVDQLTPNGRLPTEQEAARLL